MKYGPRIFALCLLLAPNDSGAADLPSVTVEHLYYLRARGQRLQEFKPEEMIEYCLGMKLGGSAFDSVYAQVLWLRTDLVRVTKVDILPASDPYVRWLNKSLEAHSGLLREEALRVQSGLVKEGSVAFDTLDAISKAQKAVENAEQK
jgi:hypothetical protein